MAESARWLSYVSSSVSSSSDPGFVQVPDRQRDPVPLVDEDLAEALGIHSPSISGGPVDPRGIDPALDGWLGRVQSDHRLALQTLQRGGKKRPELGPDVGLERAQPADLVAYSLLLGLG